MTVYDNLKGLITQGYQRIIRLACGSKSFTLSSLDYLTEKNTGNQKQKQSFLVRFNIMSSILESYRIICATKICDMNRFTLRNEDKTAIYSRRLQY